MLRKSVTDLFQEAGLGGNHLALEASKNSPVSEDIGLSKRFQVVCPGRLADGIVHLTRAGKYLKVEQYSGFKEDSVYCKGFILLFKVVLTITP